MSTWFRRISALCLLTSLCAPLAGRAAEHPLAFEPNRGQTDRQVRFLSRGPGYTLFLTPEEAVLSLVHAGSGKQPSFRSEVVRMRPLGAAPAARLEGIDPLPSHSNYLRPGAGQGVTDVPHFAKVAQRGVYPGIDLVYYGSQGNQGRLEYDFVVAPGADPAAIRLGSEGASGLSLDEAGNLHLQLAGGEIVQPAPVIYQEAAAGGRRTVAGGFTLDGGGVGFTVAAYDRSLPLVIDPQVTWATLLGGDAFDYASDIAVTANGQAYVAGYTTSTNFPTKPLSYQPTDPDPAGYDVFVSKLNLDGSQLDYSTYIGTTGSQVANAIALDSNRNAILVGTTYENDPNGDAFVMKLNAAGSALIYSKIFIGNSYDTADDVAVDASGNAYLIGTTLSTNFQTTPGAAQTLRGGDYDAFVVKLGANGDVVYSTLYGGTMAESGYGIAVDGSGRAYIAGTYGLIPEDNYTNDLFVARLNAAGSGLQYNLTFGGRNNESVSGIAVDAYNNAYVAGTTYSGNFPFTPGSYQTALRGTSAAFVSKLNNSGTAFVYSTYVNPFSGADGNGGIAVDDLGTAYIAGSFSLTGADGGAYAARLSASGGTVLAKWTLAGSGVDYCTGITLDSARNAFVSGVTNSENFPVMGNPYQSSLRGNGDAFVAKLGLSN